MASELCIALPDDATVTDVVIAIDAFVVFAANLGALLALEKAYGKSAYSSDISDTDLLDCVEAIASGEAFADYGIGYPRHSLDLSWWATILDREGIIALREFVEVFVSASPVDKLGERRDPFGRMYMAIAPNALLHPTGEHYTPFWLAQELVSQAEWLPGERLLDPFGGSGVMLLAALAEASAQGHARLDALEDLQMIELNPVTAAVAKANLIFELREEIAKTDRIVDLPVICGDTLRVALSECGRGQQDLLRDQPRAATESNASQLKKMAPVDVIVTNPPWVGWEYISRAYRDHIEPLWIHHALFESTGREAAFLKEDLSTLALSVAFDRFLAQRGRASVVLRYASMTSNAAAGGLRRLHLMPSDTPLDLRKVAIFENLRVFENAVTKAAVWHVRKGAPTAFPVTVEQWRCTDDEAAIGPDSTIAEVSKHITRNELAIRRVDPGDRKSRWTIGEPECLQAARALGGENPYRARTGVFTGGANAVYYLEPLDAASSPDGAAWYRNRTERARRKAPQTCTMLEEELVYEVIRGRDVGRWQVRGHSHLLCPHTRETKMRAIAPKTMARDYPYTTNYLEMMRPVLDRRRGFAGWEKEAREEAFYAILRIGDYTFEPYKVAWRYLADDFIVTVIPPEDSGRPRLPNDKVMYIGCEDEMEAYYLCAVLSSAPVRWKVLSSSTSTQISASVIEPLGIPVFDSDDPTHREMADACRTGHQFVAMGDKKGAEDALNQVNRLVARLFGLDEATMAAFSRACEPVTY